MRKVFLVLSVALLALTIALAWRTVAGFEDARARSRTELPLVRDSADADLARMVTEAAAALRAWDPDAEAAPGAPLERAELVTIGGTSEITRLVTSIPGGEVRARFTDSEIVVVLADVQPGAKPGAMRRGFISFESFEGVLLADPAIGEQADPFRDKSGAWSRLLLLDAATGDVLLHLAPAPEPKENTTALAPAPTISNSAGDRTQAQRDIAEGQSPDEKDYRDAGGERVRGSSALSSVFQDVWIVAEVRDSAVVMNVAGKKLTVIGFQLGRVHLWHGALALTILSLVITVGLGLQNRGIRLGHLIRVFKFVKPYTWGVILVIVLGMLFVAANTFVKVFLTKMLVDDVLMNRGDDAETMLWRIGAATGAMAFVIAGLHYSRSYLHNYYTTAIMADIRYAIGRKIVSLPLSYFDRMRSGDLVSRIERDAASMRTVYNQAFRTIAVEPFELVILVVGAFILNWRLAIVLIGMPLVVYPLFRIAKRIKKRSKKRQELLAEVSHVIFQLLIGIKVVKAFGGEERESKRLRSAILDYVEQARRIHRLAALSESLLDLLQTIGAAIVMVAGGFFVLGGGVTVGDVTAFIILIQRIYKNSKGLTGTANALVNATPGVDRVFEVLDAENDLVDGTVERPRNALVDGIRFADVSFAYGEKHVLSRVNLDIPAGKVVAIVGPTGAGKTTLCDLVARFYDPTSGSIQYDGVNVRDFTLKSLMQSVAIVTQDAFLFNSTIDENIRYGRPEATDEEIRMASVDAFVHDEIERMEGGYSKVAGERGASVSGGQRQRITIARAILKDAPVLILDEATSALDSHAEKQVQAALDKLMSGRTVIVVAHRLSTIRNADKVVVMRQGQIVEEGAPADLLQRDGGEFRRMYEMQMGTADDDDEDDAGGEVAAA